MEQLDKIPFNHEGFFERIEREHKEHFKKLRPLEDYTLDEFEKLFKEILDRK